MTSWHPIHSPFTFIVYWFIWIWSWFRFWEWRLSYWDVSEIYGRHRSSCSWTISEPRSWDETSKARANKAEPGKTSRMGAGGAWRVRCQLLSDDIEKNFFLKKIEHKKIQSANLEFGKIWKSTFWVLHIFGPRRWDAADHVLLTELQALTTASMTASSRAHGPHLETKNRKCRMFPETDKWHMAHPRIHTPTWSCHVLIILIDAKVDPSKLKSWIKTGQLYSKLFKVSLAVPCSLMYRFLLQISDASQDMDRRGLFQMIWTWPRDLHFDGRQQRIIWCKDGLLVSEDGPMPWSSWEFVNKSKSIVANQSRSSSSNMFAISSSCYCVVWLIIENCLEHAKLHIQNRQRHNLLLAYHGVFRFGGAQTPHPESPESWLTKTCKKCGNNPHQASASKMRPKHSRPSLTGTKCSPGSGLSHDHGLVHELFWKMTIYLKSHPCSFS